MLASISQTLTHCQEFATMMMKLAAALLLLSSLVSCGQAEQPKDLLCDICVDIVTDLDEWITSDSTMDDIINFVEGVILETYFERNKYDTLIIAALSCPGRYRL